MAKNRLTRTLLISVAALTILSCGGKKSTVSPPAAPDLAKDHRRAAQPATSREITKAGAEDVDRNGSTQGPDSILSPDAIPNTETLTKREHIVQTALAQIGVPYSWGGDNPEEGFDCSGLVCWTFARHGVSLPRSALELSQAGQPVSQEEVAPGDLVFYAWGSDPRKVTHVGIYIGEGDYVHSPGSGRSVYRTAAFDPAHRSRFLGARRVLPEPFTVAQDQQPQDLRTYVVRKGDYVWALARRFEVSPYQILEVNGLQLDDILQVGQELFIPTPSPD